MEPVRRPGETQGTEVFALARMRRTGLVAAYLAVMAPREKQVAQRAAGLMTTDQIAAAILARQPRERA